MTRARMVAIGLLKRAGVGSATGETVKAVAKGGWKALKTIAREGGEAAESLGVHKVVGGGAALATTAGGTYLVGREGKRRTDPFRYRHGLYLTPNQGY